MAEGTEQKQAEVKPVNVVVTNSMVGALEGLLPKNSETLKKVYEVESKIVEDGMKDMVKTPVATPKKEEGKETPTETDPAKVEVDKKNTEAAAQKAATDAAKVETEAYNKLSDDDKKAFDKKKEDYENLSPEEKKKTGAPTLIKKEEEEEEDTTVSVLGLSTKKGKKEPEVNFEKIEDLYPQIKKIAGLDIKNPKELKKFFETVEKFRTDSQSLGKEKEEKEAFKAIFEGLPENFIGAIDAYYKGDDWKKIVGDVPKFDFNKPIAKQKVDELVKHYFPGKFKDEDFEAEEKTDALVIAEQASKDKFITEQKSRETERATRTEKATKQLEAQKVSVKSSAKYLRQSFPDVQPDAEAEIVGMLTGGPAEVAKVFFNKDGSCKEEAAELLMFAKHGKSELTRMMNAAARRAETVTNEEILTRGADTPGAGIKKEGNQGDKGKISDAAKRTLGELDIFKTKKSF